MKLTKLIVAVWLFVLPLSAQNTFNEVFKSAYKKGNEEKKAESLKLEKDLVMPHPINNIMLFRTVTDMQKSGDTLGAIRVCTIYINEHPDSAFGYNTRAYLKGSICDDNSALKDLKTAMELDKSAYNLCDCSVSMGWCYKRLGQYALQKEVLLKAMDYNPKYGWHWLQLGDYYYNRFSYDSALICFREGLKVIKEYSHVYMQAAGCSHILQYQEETCEYWHKAADLGEREAYKNIDKYCK